MEDEGGVKAPVTRLRPRLSVEQSDELKSSPAPNTPTKKRGGRLAAKPELDLIDENVPENITPKRSTKKTVAKELEALEERPLTPSRRSARIKSNSSIILDPTQTFESSRAKRAARRNSQVDSDNEAPLTPARQTRRTRKNSENAEKAEPIVANKPVITEMIAEEPELSLQKSQSSLRITVEQNKSPRSLRQSPRLNKKNNISTDANEPQEALNNSETNSCEDHNTSNKENETDLKEEVKKNVSSHARENIKKINLSQSSSELLNQLKMEPEKSRSILNKIALVVINPLSFKNKIQRAESWTDISEPGLKESKFYSDSESALEKSKKGSLNDSNNIDLLQTSNLSSNENRKSVPFDSETKIQTDKMDSSKQTEKEKLYSTPVDRSKTAQVSSLEKEPTRKLQTTVCMVDCESNLELLNVEKKINYDDQCVPVVKPHSNSEDTAPQEDKNNINFNEENPNNVFGAKIENNSNSCEPMDVDETIPDNMEVNSLLETENNSKHKDSDDKDELIGNDINETGQRRKSSFTLPTSHTLETPINENKSTLGITKLHDNSDKNIVLLSQKIPTEKISKSDHILSEIQDIEIDKNNRSLNCLTSTPLQQKTLSKIDSEMNSSCINSHNNSKIRKSCNNTKSNNSNSLNKSKKSSDNSSSEEDESSAEENKFVDDEAEEASDNYESGDSKDEEEEQYERENEIIHKGETLTSEDELSNDSDYDKDSFVVSSNEEDDALLDGSGDDLSMTDDELKMTAKSKNKYNERKVKEQKRASREMFESRHKLNVSKNNIKPEYSKIKKRRAVLESSDSDDDDMHMAVKKNNRMRLDSSHEASFDKTLNDSANTQKVKNLSKSVPNNRVSNEVEMTVTDENTKDESDHSSKEMKKEPKTPQNGRPNSAIEYIDTIHSKTDEDGNNKSQEKEECLQNPLENSNASDSSESCDNVHIQNYDSVLSDLNKSMKTKKSKDGDVSLNLDKKIKQKHTVPIVDQLNLTQFKTNKVKKNELKSANIVQTIINKSFDEKSKESYTKMQPECVDVDKESSASIDLNLLFSEESNSSNNTQSKVNSFELEINEKDAFIQLKETQNRTNILEASGFDEPMVNESAKKKNKKRRTIDKSVVDDETCDDTEVQFYIDTTGTRNSTAVDDSSSVHGTNKAKEVTEDDDKDDDAPLEVFNKEKLERRSQISDIEEEMNKTDLAIQNKSLVMTPKSDMKKKKKKKRSESLTVEQTANQGSMEMDHISSSNSTKKQKPKTIEDIEDKATNSSPIKTPVSEKKKLKKTSNVIEDMDKSLNEQNYSLGRTSNIKKKSINTIGDTPAKDSDKKGTQELVTSKKRKRRSSCDQTDREQDAGDETTSPPKTLNYVNSTDNQEKKRKISHNTEDLENQNQNKIMNTSPKVHKNTNHDVKRKKHKQPLRDEIDIENNTIITDTVLDKKKGTTKRKDREDDEGNRKAKVQKINSFDKLFVPRLPTSILSQLNNKPKRINPEGTKPTAVSTTDFDVEENKKIKLKPSKYLEESIYINENETSDSKKHKSVTNPKVLPSLPTALTSNSGYTTNFKVNVLPKKIEFVAKSSSVSNFKNDYLQNKKMKLGTYELYKKQRNFKMSKF